MSIIKKTITISEASRLVGAELVGDGEKIISGLSSLSLAGESELTFINDMGKAVDFGEINSAGLIVSKQVDDFSRTQLIVGNVDKAITILLNYFAPELEFAPGIHPAAVIDSSAVVAPSASIGAGVYIGPDAKIGENVILSPGCKVGRSSVIGDNTRLDYNVSVYHECVIGRNCVVQANSTIGSVGYGYNFIDGQHQLVPHLGGVLIEDCVELGANVCVDRAKFGNTIVGAGTKVDNLVQIAHNVTIGKCCLIISQTAIAGSVVLGNGVVLAGQVGVNNHLKIGDGAQVGAKSLVISDLEPGKSYLGNFCLPAKETLRIRASQKKLPELLREFKKLKSKVAELEKANDNKN